MCYLIILEIKSLKLLGAAGRLPSEILEGDSPSDISFDFQ